MNTRRLSVKQIWSNALQEAVGHTHPKLHRTLPQLKTQKGWSPTLYNRSVESSFHFH